MTEDINMNIPSVSVDEFVDEMMSVYIPVINAGIPVSNIPAAMLWGAPGVGKSAGIEELAEKLGRETGKRVDVTDVRLLLFSPVDLRGVPVADPERKFTDWLMPRIFDMDTSGDVINILFLDELTAAAPSVQAAAYQITLNRAVGEHKLPDNTIVMAAGNRTTDHSVAYRMPNALANRLMHFHVKVDPESWKRYAIDNGVNPLVLGYLSFDSSKLCRENVGLDSLAYPTPRSWMAVSSILNAVGEQCNPGTYGRLIKANIGTGAAMEFIAWCNVYSKLPRTEDIFAGKRVAYPGTPDVLYALIGAITSFAVSSYRSNGKAALTVAALDNMCRFINGFPKDYAVCTYRGLLQVDGLCEMMAKTEMFRQWLKKSDDFVRNNRELLDKCKF
jgi:hypothetical protein